MPLDPSPRTIIAPTPPRDGRDWDCQCARCGSSVGWMECETCGGEGIDGHDCGEDCCCCADPDENVRCGICDGEGGWPVCASSVEWCSAHPIAGRAQVEGGAIEWFVVEGEA